MVETNDSMKTRRLTNKAKSSVNKTTRMLHKK